MVVFNCGLNNAPIIFTSSMTGYVIIKTPNDGTIAIGASNDADSMFG